MDSNFFKTGCVETFTTVKFQKVKKKKEYSEIVENFERTRDLHLI